MKDFLMEFMDEGEVGGESGGLQSCCSSKREGGEMGVGVEFLSQPLKSMGGIPSTCDLMAQGSNSVLNWKKDGCLGTW